MTDSAGGPILLPDHHLIEKMAQVDRERVPERGVDAEGAGGFGRLVVTGGGGRPRHPAVVPPRGRLRLAHLPAHRRRRRVVLGGAPLKTQQGIERLTQDEADRLAGSAPDHHRQDSFGWIRYGDCPSWSMEVQVMSCEDAETHRYDPFELTKLCSQKDHPG